MIRLLGAALLLLGALLAGQALTGLLRRKRAVLRELRGFVETLQAELLQRGTPLPELFARQADRQGLLWEPVRDCGKALARGVPADRAMEPLLETLKTGRPCRRLPPLWGSFPGRWENMTPGRRPSAVFRPAPGWRNRKNSFGPR